MTREWRCSRDVGASFATMAESVVLVGTTKGLFCLVDGEIQGPHFKGTAVDACAYDERTGTVLVGSHSEHWGPSVFRSDDLGASWHEPDGGAIRFPTDTGAALARVWQIEPGRDDEPDVVWAGVEPAALSDRPTAARPSSSSGGCGTIPTGRTGSRAGAGSACTPSSPTPRSRNAVGRHLDGGGLPHRRRRRDVVGPQRGHQGPTHPGPIPSSASASTRSTATPTAPTRCTPRTTGGSTAATTAATTGRTSARAPSVTSASRWSSTRPTPTGSTSSRSSPTSTGARPTADAGCSARTTAAGRGRRSSEGLPQDQAHLTILRDGFCHDGASPPVCGSAPAPASSSAPSTPATPGRSPPPPAAGALRPRHEVG